MNLRAVFIFSFLFTIKIFGPGKGMKPDTMILVLSGFTLLVLLITKISALFGFNEKYNLKTFIAASNKKWRHDYYKSLLWAFWGILVGSALADQGITGGLYTGIIIGIVFWLIILILMGKWGLNRIKNKKIKKDKKGNYTTLEEFETSLKKELGDLGVTVSRKTEPENPNKFEVKFIGRSQKKKKGD